MILEFANDYVRKDDCVKKKDYLRKPCLYLTTKHHSGCKLMAN